MNRRLISLAVLPAAAGIAHAQVAQDHAFTYQGRLTNGGGPANGTYDLEFKAFDAVSGGTQYGPTIEAEDVPVADGVFTTGINFGAGLFAGQKFWLEIGVRDGASTEPYTTLDPRSEITSAPYASCALFPWELGAGQIWYNGGNVGIGTASPTSKLEIAAQDGLAISGFQPYVTLRDTNAGDARSYIQGIAGDVVFVPDSFALQTPPLIVKNNTGNVGIGTFNPAYRLHVVGAVSQPFPLVCELNSNGPGNAIRGVVGPNASGNFTSGVTGVNSAPAGPSGAFGMYAEHASNGTGIRAVSATGHGVQGIATAAAGFGGYFVNTAPGGVALWADGTARVKILHITGGSDLAEPFDVSSSDGDPAAPGMVVVIDPDHPGRLRVATEAYDAKVAGVISGANGLAAGMVLRADGAEHADGEHPVAMTGRVWCRADALSGVIRPGDRLTTSSTPGHAMRVGDPARADGAVIGKAMTGLAEGRGLVLVLVNLQ